MTQFYLILAGMYLYYSNSRYFPDFLFKPDLRWIQLIGTLLSGAGTLLYIWSDGWAGGLLLSLTACTLAMGIVQLFGVLGKAYFYGLAAVVHFLLILDLLSYAR